MTVEEEIGGGRAWTGQGGTREASGTNDASGQGTHLRMSSASPLDHPLRSPWAADKVATETGTDNVWGQKCEHTPRPLLRAHPARSRAQHRPHAAPGGRISHQPLPRQDTPLSSADGWVSRCGLWLPALDASPRTTSQASGPTLHPTRGPSAHLTMALP